MSCSDLFSSFVHSFSSRPIHLLSLSISISLSISLPFNSDLSYAVFISDHSTICHRISCRKMVSLPSLLQTSTGMQKKKQTIPVQRKKCFPFFRALYFRVIFLPVISDHSFSLSSSLPTSSKSSLKTPKNS